MSDGSDDDPFAEGAGKRGSGESLRKSGSGVPSHVSPPAAAAQPPAPAAPVGSASEVVLRRSTDRLRAASVVPVTAAAMTMIKPVAEIEEALVRWREYNQLKGRLLSKDDYYQYKDSLKKVPRRTGWRKLALFFGVSTDIVDERRWERGDDWGYDFLARASAPNGQTMVASGTCTRSDIVKARGQPTEHNVRAKAETRAKNRAISDLIGGGELSAEEVDDA